MKEILTYGGGCTRRGIMRKSVIKLENNHQSKSKESTKYSNLLSN